MRSATFADAWPPPMAVPVGPLIAASVRTIDSMVEAGRFEPVRAATSAPASPFTHSSESPSAPRTWMVASTTSGPMPSPSMYVIA